MDETFAKILLIALPLVPAFGAILAGVLPARSSQAMRAVGWTFSIGALLVWIMLRAILTGSEGLLVSVNVPWVPSLGISLHLGLDGVGFMMAGMVAFVSVAATVGTIPTEPEWTRTHIVCLLLAEAGMLGVVAAWDLLLFIAFWDVTLVAFFFLMGTGRKPSSAATA